MICSWGRGFESHQGQTFLFLRVGPFLFYGYRSEGINWDIYTALQHTTFKPLYIFKSLVSWAYTKLLFLQVNNTNITLGVDDELYVPSNDTHMVYTVSDTPSCWMYVYTNMTILNNETLRNWILHPGKSNILVDKIDQKVEFVWLFVCLFTARYLDNWFKRTVLIQVYFKFIYLRHSIF